MILPGRAATGTTGWQPALLMREQTLAAVDRARPVLYVHGATFPSACSIMFRFDRVSWADVLACVGFSVWAFDFAGFGGSEAYPDDPQMARPPGQPLGRAPEAAGQIERVVRAVLAETGAARVSIIAHSWGTIAAGRFAAAHPDLVDRLVLFGPIVRRETVRETPPLDPLRLVTIAQQYQRFVEDVPAGHPPVLLDRHFRLWAEAYLASDRHSAGRSPPSVRIPNGPAADIMAAWSGRLGYDPGLITAPTAILRGEWDSLTTDADAAWLMAALTGTPEKRDIKIARGTHLMHLEESRGDLYRATIAFLQGTEIAP
ncbi:alpha/beta fold hydrolase [Phreatobacter stygius]|nr:alpha/beta fold hydrolase [Phreatobacter stygius]